MRIFSRAMRIGAWKMPLSLLMAFAMTHERSLAASTKSTTAALGILSLSGSKPAYLPPGSVHASVLNLNISESVSP